MSSAPGATGPVDDKLAKPLEDSLTHLVAHSDVHTGAGKDELAPSEKRADAVHSHGEVSKSWISKFWPSEETLDKLFNYEHMGNYVIDRRTGKKNFESMPIYVRVGMHLLFVKGSSYMSYASIEHLLTAQSIKQGQMYDQTGPEVKAHIQSFIDTYDLPLDELLVQDLDEYPTFNSFFSRRLKPSARPITSPEDPSIIVSPADCRLTVFNSVASAKQFWFVIEVMIQAETRVKGKKFSVPALLAGEGKHDGDLAGFEEGGCSLAIARLAPQDYHRFHSPVEGTVIGIKDIKGELYTVNPQAINEDLNVFTLNKRSVMLIKANLGKGRESVTVALVAVGAMLVGSIGWSKKAGDKVGKGEGLGWFQYGGSTVIVVFPPAAGVTFDADLRTTSEKSMETLVQVGMEIGKVA